MPHGPVEVGVGPWEGPWPTGPQWDPELLAGVRAELESVMLADDGDPDLARLLSA